MARLLLLNGVPCSGKSTLARRYADDHPMTLALDIDVVRSQLGGWVDAPEASGVAARTLALAMARTHLAGGHDVVVPQLLARPEFIVQLEGLAADAGVPFDEVVLQVGADDMLRRFRARSAQGARIEHCDAADLVRRAGGEAELLAVHARLAALVAARPDARLVVGGGEDADTTYSRLLEVLSTRGAPRPPAPGRVRLTGQLVCRSAEEVRAVSAHLAEHVALTRAEPGCVRFDVVPAGDGATWQVDEVFTTTAAFRAHQARVAASTWGRETAAVERRYTVVGVDDADSAASS